jgi:hypothetical protein
VILVLSALAVCSVIYWATLQIVAEMRAARDEAARGRALAIAQLFGPAPGAVERDPRALLTWHPLAQLLRQLFPTDFAEIDRAAGGTFPFTKEQIQAAHSQWTADWLGWERAHDAEYKLKAASVEKELALEGSLPGGSAVTRARIDAVEREKLDLYQRRYQDYVRVAKALQALGS